MKRKSPRLLVAGIGAAGLAVVISCGVFLHRGQQRLLDLVGHTSQKTTDVYSTWMTLQRDAGLTWDYVLKTLELTGYESVPGKPQRAGEYSVSAPHLYVWTRGFTYPDQALPAQALHLAFSGRELSGIETLPDEKTVDAWRLEPKRLAQWAQGGATQPQVHLSELPAYAPLAVVAIEDKRFFEHGAIDFRGLARALWIDLRKGELRQGGSTLTQQLSRSIFLDIKRTWRRKILEAGLAFYLEAVYSKNQLLEMYLNQVYWGQAGAQSLLGLESASRSFFGKPARKLTLGESALLAGLLQSPNHYSPRANLAVARKRRDLVLSLMLEQGHITGDQAQTAMDEPIALAPLATRAGEAPYFIATLQDVLQQRYSFGALMTQGWRIFTTLDPVLQAQATTAVKPSEGQAALVAIDPRNGAVRAWVGGTSYGKSTFDRVVYARRQPGSAFKPFVMLAAIDSRFATTATRLLDEPYTVKTPQGDWSPQNYDKKFRGKVSLWDALVQSLNVPTVRLASDMGVDKVAEYAARLGIRSPLRAVPSLALGTSEVTVMELTSAYATLASGGRYVEPYSIEMILDPESKVIQEWTPQPQQAVAEPSVFIVTQMLRAVFEEGTAKWARQMGFTHQAAGKTGTSENYQDAWFIGFTPRLAAGVWVGYDQPKSLGRAAAGIALPVWVSFMQKALSYWPEDKFAEPKDLEWKVIDVESGDLARSGCPRRRKEAFLPGTAPEKMCDAHPGGLMGFFYRLKNRVQEPAKKP